MKRAAVLLIGCALLLGGCQEKEAEKETETSAAAYEETVTEAGSEEAQPPAETVGETEEEGSSEQEMESTLTEEEGSLEQEMESALAEEEGSLEQETESDSEEEESVDPQVWRSAYADAVNRWQQERGDTVLGYQLFYLDADDIPELCMFAEGGNEDIDMYTVVDGQAVHLKRYDGNGQPFESEITSEWRQAQHDSYLEKEGIYAYGGGGMGNIWIDWYMLQNGRLEQILYSGSIRQWDEEKEELSEENQFTLRYKKQNGEWVEVVRMGDEMLSDCPELKEIEAEYGICWEDSKFLYSGSEGVMDYQTVLDWLAQPAE